MNSKTNHRNIVVASILLVALIFGFVQAPQPVSASACDWAQFVADVTVPDGTVYGAGAAFSKTWRIKNIGTCTWTTGYALVFVSGSQMGGAASTNLATSVAPGATIDLTLAMTAPTTAGTYRGNWELKNASSVIFGIGSSSNLPFWVEINVAGSGGGTGYDFVSNAASATWTNGSGTAITFGAAESDNGFAKKMDAPVLENGVTDTSAGLLTGPQNIYGGSIQGVYPAFTVQSGDHFQSIINCEFNATSCYVTFRLNYQIGTGPILTYWTFNERYEGLYYRADIDLSALAGQSVKFILYVNAAGYATGDRALWGAPRITRSSGTIATVTPSGATPTATPSISSCDRATFISDVNYPDGTVLSPNTAFTKTWSIKNTGSCTWTTGYKLVFASGEKMGGSDTNLTSTIAPNTTVSFSTNLTSPSTAGTYRGYWMLKNASNQIFGIGFAGDRPWWVEIAVSGSATAVPATLTPTPGAGIATNTPTPTATSSVVLDFTNPPSAAVWTSGAATAPVYDTGTDPNDNGVADKLTSVQVENTTTINTPSLLMVPNNLTSGYIQGIFPAVLIHTGDKLQSTIGCQYNATNCFVTYRIGYQIGSSAVTYFSDLHERYDGLSNTINIDLSSLNGQTVTFILRVVAQGSSTDTVITGASDRALWVAPRIVH